MSRLLLALRYEAARCASCGHGVGAHTRSRGPGSTFGCELCRCDALTLRLPPGWAPLLEEPYDGAREPGVGGK